MKIFFRLTTLAIIIFLLGCAPSIKLTVNAYQSVGGPKIGQSYLALKPVEGTDCNKAKIYVFAERCALYDVKDDALVISYFSGYKIGQFIKGGDVNKPVSSALAAELRDAGYIQAADNIFRIKPELWKQKSISLRNLQKKYYWKLPSGRPSLFDWSKQLDLSVVLDQNDDVEILESFRWTNPGGPRIGNRWQ